MDKNGNAFATTSGAQPARPESRQNRRHSGKAGGRVAPKRPESGGGEKLRSCCESFWRDNHRLERALEKERDRRRRVTIAFNKLLQAYRSVVDVNEIFNSSSFSSDIDNDDYGEAFEKRSVRDEVFEDEEESEAEKENFFLASHAPAGGKNDEQNNNNLVVGHERQRSPGPDAMEIGNVATTVVDSLLEKETTATTKTTKSIFRNRISVLPATCPNANVSCRSGLFVARSDPTFSQIPFSQHSVDFAASDTLKITKKFSNPEQTKKETTKNYRSEPRGAGQSLIGNASEEQMRAINHHSGEDDRGEYEDSRDIVKHRSDTDHRDNENNRYFYQHNANSHQHKTSHHYQPSNRRSSEWYFVALEDEERARNKAATRQSRMDSWLQSSAERRRQIAATSQRRAQIAGQRRAVAMDVLRGRRPLDDEALRILHTDSSTISSFPERVMRQMRSASRKKYVESQRRLDKERGTNRDKHLQMATNKILAHTSATIAKCVATNSRQRRNSSAAFF